MHPDLNLLRCLVEHILRTALTSYAQIGYSLLKLTAQFLLQQSSNWRTSHTVSNFGKICIFFIENGQTKNIDHLSLTCDGL